MNNKQINLILFGVFLLFIGILFGAFGAHALKKVLPLDKLNSFETGVRYQLIHGLAFLFFGLLNTDILIRMKRILLILGTGVLFFSFSIYLLSLQDFFKIKIPTLFGIITPLGGTLILISWLLIAYQFIQIKRKQH